MEQDAVVVRHPETGEIVVQRTVLSYQRAEDLQLGVKVEQEQAEVDAVEAQIQAALEEVENLKDVKADKERSLEKSKRLFDGYQTLVGEPTDGDEAQGVVLPEADRVPEPIF